MTSAIIQNDVIEIVSELSTEELESLFKTHERLNPRGKKETQEDWIQRFEPRKDKIIYWAEYFNEVIEYLKETYSISKSSAQEKLAHYLRQRQENELQYTHSLINPVKISLICNLEKHLSNPGSIAIKSRSAKSSKSRQVTKQPTKTQANKIKSLDQNGLTVLSLRSQENIIFGTLVNSSSTPLQNIKLEVMHDKNRLKIKSCAGENFQLAAGSIHIPFMQASMSATPKKTDFKIELDGYFSGEEHLILSVYVDDPEIKKVITGNFQITSI